MSSIPYLPLGQSVVNGSGRPYAAATATFYRAGTTTALTVYADSARQSSLGSVVTASAAGKFSPIFLDPTYDARCILKDSSGNTLSDDDNIPSAYAAYFETETGETGVVDHRSPVGDVRRYGVVGDGTTDDTAALIAAGSACKRVYIDPSLNCKVTGTLASGIQSDQLWYGGGTITVGDNVNFNVFEVSGKTGVVIDGLRGVSGSLDTSLIATMTARFVSFKSNSDHCVMRNCDTTGFQSAVQVNQSDYCRVINNTVRSPYGWGINIQVGSDFCIVENNTVLGSGTLPEEHGIYLGGNATYPVKYCTVRGNRVSGCKLEGIKVSNYIYDAVVEGNHSIGNGHEGIYNSLLVDRVTITHNVCEANGHNGILLYQGVMDAVVAHNQCYANVYSGISLQEGVAYASLHGNHCRYNGVAGNQYGIVFSGSTALVISAITKTSPAVLTFTADHLLATGTHLYISGVGGMTQLTDGIYRATRPSWTVSAITKANPAAVTTSTAHGLTTGDRVNFSVSGMTEVAGGNHYTITVTGDYSFTLDGVNSTGYGTFTSGTVRDSRRLSLDGIDSSAYSSWTSGGTANYGSHACKVESNIIRDQQIGVYINWGALNQIDDNVYAGNTMDLYLASGQAIGTRVNGFLEASFTWDPVSLNDGAGETKSVTVTGAAFGDAVEVAAPYDLQDCTVTAYVQAANTVEVRLQQESGTGPIDFANGTWKVYVRKRP